METPEPAQEPQLINDDPRDPSGAKSFPRFDLPDNHNNRNAATGSGDSILPLSLFSWAVEKVLSDGNNRLSLECVPLAEFLFRGKN